MRTRVVVAILAMAPLWFEVLYAQSVPVVGQGPPTRRDSRWRIQQERSDFVRDAREELALLLRRQSIAEVVTFLQRQALPGIVDLPGERPVERDRFDCCGDGRRGGWRDGIGDGRWWWNDGLPWRWTYPLVPGFWRPELLDLRPEWLVPVRRAKHGLLRLGRLEEPQGEAPAVATLEEQLPLILALARESRAPRRNEEPEYDEAPRRQRSRPLNTGNKDVPDYCYSGEGHPLGGREWCYRHGYEVGGGWVRESDHGISMERPRSPINRAQLALSIGPDLATELEVERVRLGLSQPIVGSYVATLENGAVLKVRSGRTAVAEIDDHDRDGRVDAIWRRTDR